MAVTSDIWVRAHLRRCFAHGLTGVIERKGAAEAGAIFVKVFESASAVRLFGPPPGPAYNDNGARRWIARSEGLLTPDAADALINRQLAFDPDIWVLQIDDRGGQGLLEIEREDNNSVWP